MLAFLGVIIFALGILVGFLLAVALYAFEFILDWSKPVIMGMNTTPRKAIEQVLKRKFPRTGGSVIMPPTDREIAQEEMIRRNEAEGKPTPLADL